MSLALLKNVSHEGRQRLRERHHPMHKTILGGHPIGNAFCAACEQDMPCEMIRALDLLDTNDQLAAALRALVEAAAAGVKRDGVLLICLYCGNIVDRGETLIHHPDCPIAVGRALLATLKKE